ncbi:MAG: prephenate/arogenate dehydrogenase [Cyanobacteria bacterium J06632_22]
MPPPPIIPTRIGIVGLGLIGGSLALDLCAQGHEIWGVSRRDTTCQRALQQSIVHHASTNLASLAPVDVVFICTPISAILPTLSELAAHLTPTTVVTDVGSVKGSLVTQATELWPRFVGGHPMSGKAEAGLTAATPHLFQQRPYVLTPLPSTPADAVEQVTALIRQLGSTLYIANPDDHDQAVALISHLPVMLGASLLHTCTTSPQQTLAQQLASSGFKDTSRVGGGNPELGRLMAQYNQPALLAALAHYQSQLTQLTQAIADSDWNRVESYLTAAHQDRPAFVTGA